MASKTINWALEAAALRDMSVTAVRGHVVTAEAIYDAVARASRAQEQKILFAKMCAEEIAALEDLGALGRAIAARRTTGILHNYLAYEAKEIHRFYVNAQTTGSTRTLLDLPSDEQLKTQLSDDDVATVVRSLVELQPVFRDAAQDYLALDGKLLNTYNKIKHGFNIVQRIDLLVSPDSIHADWRQQVHVLTGIRRDGRVNFTSIERSHGMLDSLMKVITMCSLAWKECAALMIWLIEHDVSLSD